MPCGDPSDDTTVPATWEDYGQGGSDLRSCRELLLQQSEALTAAYERLNAIRGLCDFSDWSRERAGTGDSVLLVSDVRRALLGENAGFVKS